MVKELLKNPDINLKVRDKDEKLPLHRAVENNDLSIVELLLQHPAIDVNAIVLSRWKRLYIEVIDSSDDEEYITHEWTRGTTALHVAVKNKRPEMVQLLLTHEEIRINAKNTKHQTPMCLAEKIGNIDIAEILRAHGGKI